MPPGLEAKAQRYKNAVDSLPSQQRGS